MPPTKTQQHPTEHAGHGNDTPAAGAGHAPPPMVTAAQRQPGRAGGETNTRPGAPPMNKATTTTTTDTTTKRPRPAPVP